MYNVLQRLLHSCRKQKQGSAYFFSNFPNISAFVSLVLIISNQKKRHCFEGAPILVYLKFKMLL